MSGRRGSPKIIPRKGGARNLSGNLGTSETKEHEKTDARTGDIRLEGVGYKDVPPATPRQSLRFLGDWWKIFLNLIAVLAVLGPVLIFFNNLGSNVQNLQADVKNSTVKIDKLNEGIAKQSFAIENATLSVQRLEGEVRRTQDYIRPKEK